MKINSLNPGACSLLLMLCPSVALAGAAPQVEVKEEAAQWVIEAVGTETAPPDLIHLMMKMETQSGLAADATRNGGKQLSEFLAAVDRLHIPDLTYRVANNLITTAWAGEGEFSGFVYTRNIIFTFPQPQPGASPADVDRIVAQLEDLGARNNSHCVTCIGSG
jgi:hypothetical protein